MRLNRSRGIVVAMGLSVIAVSQGGCIFSWIPHYEPGFDCVVEAHDAKSGELIGDELLVLEYDSKGPWTEVYVVAGPVAKHMKLVSAELSRVDNGLELSRWGRCICKIPMDPLGLGVRRRFYTYGAFFFKDGYYPTWITRRWIIRESEKCEGSIVLDMRPATDLTQMSMFSEDVDSLLTTFLPKIPASDPNRRELLILLERQATRLLDVAKDMPPESPHIREVDLPYLRETTLPMIRKALAAQAKAEKDGN